MLAAACAVGVGCCFAAPIGGRRPVQPPALSRALPPLPFSSALSPGPGPGLKWRPPGPSQVSCSALRSPPPSSRCGTIGGASLLPPSVPSSSGSWRSGTVMKVGAPGGCGEPLRWLRWGPRCYTCLPLPSLQKLSLLSSKPGSGLTSPLTSRNCQLLLSLGEELWELGLWGRRR